MSSACLVALSDMPLKVLANQERSFGPLDSTTRDDSFSPQLFSSIYASDHNQGTHLRFVWMIFRTCLPYLKISDKEQYAGCWKQTKLDIDDRHLLWISFIGPTTDQRALV
jgi:hypothetical protein